MTGAPDPHAATKAAALVSDPRFRRCIERAHRLGPRVVAELVADLAVRTGAEPTALELAARYAAIEPAALDVTGGDRLPPLPLHEVA